jgi:hypothetical protein
MAKNEGIPEGPYLIANRTGRRIGGGGDPELAVEGGAADMEQENSTPAGPTHLPRRFRNGKYRLSLINDDGM